MVPGNLSLGLGSPNELFFPLNHDCCKKSSTPLKFNSSPLKNYQNPIGTATRLPFGHPPWLSGVSTRWKVSGVHNVMWKKSWNLQAPVTCGWSKIRTRTTNPPIGFPSFFFCVGIVNWPKKTPWLKLPIPASAQASSLPHLVATLCSDHLVWTILIYCSWRLITTRSPAIFGTVPPENDSEKKHTYTPWN